MLFNGQFLFGVGLYVSLVSPPVECLQGRS